MGATCSDCANGREIATVRGKIHGTTLSVNTMSCLMFAVDVGAGILQPCSLENGENQTLQFMRKNPFQQIPVWEEADGFCLGETCAILRYIAGVFAPNFYHLDPKRIARIDFALDNLNRNVLPKWKLRINPVLWPESSHCPAPHAANNELQENLDKFVTGFLGDGRFCCGEHMTIVEYRILPMLYVLRHPAMKRITGLELSARLNDYLDDILAMCPSSRGLLQSANGPAFDEFLDCRDDSSPYEGEVVVVGQNCGAMEKMQIGLAESMESCAKIWGVQMSMDVQTCILFARDHGIGDLAMVNLLNQEHKNSVLSFKNVFQQIPVYEGSDGFTLGESSAILRYMAQNYASTTYYPDDAKTRSKVDWVLDNLTTEIVPRLTRVVYPALGLASKPDDQVLANEDALESLRLFETTFLEMGSFVLGERPSIAEYKALPYLFVANELAVYNKTGFCLPPRSARYLQDILTVINAHSLTCADSPSMRSFLNNQDVFVTPTNNCEVHV